MIYNKLVFRKPEKPLDGVSTLINRWKIPTTAQIRGKLGEDNETAFWATFAAIYGVDQRSRRPIASHAYDLVMRPVVRRQYNPSNLETQVGLPHDLPEDVLKRARYELPHEDIKPIVAAYVMIDILADILGQTVAYGRLMPNGEGDDTPKRYGGVISEINFNELIARPVLSTPSFLDSSRPKFEKGKVDGVEYAYLTKDGRQLSILVLDEIYKAFRITEKEILRAYEFVKGRYQRFVNVHLPQSGLSIEEQHEISEGFVNRFISVIERKISEGGIVRPKSLKELVMTNYADVRSLVNDPDNEKPADLSLILSHESPHVITLEKTLYSGYISRGTSDVVEAARRALKYGKIREEPYLHSFIVKGMDLTDTTAGMGPNLDNITSINRKDRIFLPEGASALAQLNELSVPAEDAARVYHVLNYLLGMLKFKVNKLYRDFNEEKDTMYDEHKEVLARMREKIPDLERVVRGSRPPSRPILERLREIPSHIALF